MNTGMDWAALPLSTINPSALGAQTSPTDDNPWRPSQWITSATDVMMQKPENHAALWSLLESLPVQPAKVTQTNPLLKWRVDKALDQFARLTADLAADATTISLDQPGMIKTGYVLYLPETDQQVYVSNVSGSTVTISRTTLPGPARAATSGQSVYAGMPLMGETGEPKEGITTIPGDALFNFVQLTGLWVQMTKMQQNSLMAGDFGTHEKLIRDNQSRINQMIQQTILNGRRGTLNTSAEGQIYMTDGLIRQVRDNVLDAGNFGNTLIYDNLSNFWDGLFESSNSSSTKKHVCGEQQFMQFVQTARQAGMITEEIHYNPDLGVDEFDVVTGGGRTVTVAKMRYAFEGAQSAWGLTLDLGNLVTGEYAGFGWRWLYDLDIPMHAITTKTDAIVGSLSVAITDPDTCGLVRGGVSKTLERNTLGPVTE
jgi:hypothetical protein